MELCSRCNGTGHHGSCEACGGSGFIESAALSLPKRAVAYIPEPAPTLKRTPKPRHPALMIEGELMHGLAADQLIFPADTDAFQSATIREQVRHIISKHPCTKRINWLSTFLCRVLLADGSERIEDFGQANPQKTRTRSEHLITPLAPEQPKRARRTIPHVSQGGPVPGKKTKKRKAAPGEVRPPRTTIKAPKSKPRERPEGKGGPSVRAETQRAPRETALELAFARAKAELASAELDGSRQWSGFRDAGSGQFGSYPAFDPADDGD